MSNITLNLEEKEAQFIHALLTDLPNKSGSYPLLMKVTAQINEQVQPTDSAPIAEAEAEAA